MNLLSTVMAAETPINNAFVVAMGIGTVFTGLICIIILIKLVSIFLGNTENKTESPTPVAKQTPAQAPAAAPAVIENRAEIIAAVCAAAAEELGTDVSALRVVSFKKL